VAVRQPLLAALPALGADQLRHLRLHQLLHNPEKRLVHEIKPLALEQVAHDLLFVSAIVVTPLVVVLEDPTSLSATVAGPTTTAPSDTLLHHAKGRDRA
jgi:hypothetical protein